MPTAVTEPSPMARAEEEGARTDEGSAAETSSGPADEASAG
jgi:hypothetical protein